MASASTIATTCSTSLQQTCSSDVGLIQKCQSLTAACTPVVCVQSLVDSLVSCAPCNSTIIYTQLAVNVVTECKKVGQTLTIPGSSSAGTSTLLDSSSTNSAAASSALIGIPSSTTTVASLSSSSTSTATSASPKTSHLSAGAIAGIVIGLLAFLGLLIAAALFWHRRRRHYNTSFLANSMGLESKPPIISKRFSWTAAHRHHYAQLGPAKFLPSLPEEVISGEKRTSRTWTSTEPPEPYKTTGSSQNLPAPAQSQASLAPPKAPETSLNKSLPKQPFPTLPHSPLLTKPYVPRASMFLSPLVSQKVLPSGNRPFGPPSQLSPRTASIPSRHLPTAESSTHHAYGIDSSNYPASSSSPPQPDGTALHRRGYSDPQLTLSTLDSATIAKAFGAETSALSRIRDQRPLSALLSPSLHTWRKPTDVEEREKPSSATQQSYATQNLSLPQPSRNSTMPIYSNGVWHSGDGVGYELQEVHRSETHLLDEPMDM